MRIGIIGAGRVGRALAKGWHAQGHDIRLGVRDPASAASGAAAAETGAAATTVGEAARHGEAVILATPWGTTEAAVAACGDLAGKLVIDCTNPLSPGSRALALGFSDSGGETVARWAVGARVVKTFNTIDSSNMARPRFGGTAPGMFLCGDDAAAKAIAAGLVAGLGFEPVDCGALRAARLLEPFALLWIGLIYERGHGPGIGYKLLRRDEPAPTAGKS